MFHLESWTVVSNLIFVFAWSAETENLSDCQTGLFPSLTDPDALKTYLGLSIQCLGSKVSINISSCRLENLGLQNAADVFISNETNVDVTTLTRNCTFDRDGEMYTAEFKFDDCGASEETSGNYSVYKYLLNFKLSKPTSATIVRANNITLGFTCQYVMTSETLSIGQLNPEKVTSKVNLVADDAITGIINTTIKAYSDEGLQNKLDAADHSIAVGQNFYVFAEIVSGGGNLILQATKCWATPTSNPEDSKRVTLIENGCAQTLTHIIENYNSSRVIFGVETFAWAGTNAEDRLHIHCEFRVCNASVFGDACKSNTCGRRKRHLHEELPSLSAFAIIIAVNLSTCAQSRCEDICALVDGASVCLCAADRELQEDGTTCEDVGLREGALSTETPEPTFEQKHLAASKPTVSMLVKDVVPVDLTELKVALAFVYLLTMALLFVCLACVFVAMQMQCNIQYRYLPSEDEKSGISV